MNRNTILSSSPWIEVLIKTLYWKSPTVHKVLAARKRRRIDYSQLKSTNREVVPFEKVLDALNSLGVRRNGIMIVHSSAVALSPMKLSPKEICNGLLAYLGSEGTLAMPAIPLFREEPTGPSRLNNEICSKRLNYNVQSTMPWTGAIPKALMGISGSVRSRHPLNTMVAVGPEALKMMAHNINGLHPLPCGPQSSWKYCADRDATIVCLGVDSSHSLTMIHVAEDCWSNQWPVPNWYRERLFHVKDGDFETDLTVLERHPRWAINYAERTLQKDLLRLGIIKVKEVDGIRIEVCSSAQLLDYLCSRRASAYPYWIPSWDQANK